jgi:hypothetical protein
VAEAAGEADEVEELLLRGELVQRGVWGHGSKIVTVTHNGSALYEACTTRAR